MTTDKDTPEELEPEFDGSDSTSHNVIHLSGMYENWFLDYASYVILERAVPAIEDGLKPVQRRILHAMWEMDDGRYNKVANIIGHTMKYHPHGDASIGDALVGLGQKELLIDQQGNWGNILTGDSAAAPRYIEARPSKFALEVAFNPKTTVWQSSYDGRNKEPVTLPMKFPLLLAQGVEGIAVGLATKILPHNFNELIDGSIAVLRGRKPVVLPDFPTGGMADFSNYNDGMRGGRIRVRAKISALDKKTLVISEIPFSTTTASLIDSIIAANDKGKIKIRKVEDNTAEHVEIIIHLAAGISPDKTIDALYAFTSCEISISPNACVIETDKPNFLGVTDILKISTHRTLELLKRELEIKLSELQEQWHFASLEKIFIKEEMYIDFKKYDNREDLYQYLYACFKPFKKKLVREINDDDLLKLTQIPMIRITKFDSFKADEKLKELETAMAEVKEQLASLVDYAVEYFKNLKKKYGEGRERKTEIKSFENIVATSVAVANEKLYVNRLEGFAGYGMKKDEFVCDCSDIDDIIVFRKDGTMLVTKVQEKTFVGKDVVHINVFKKNDERTIYNMVYRDGPRGNIMVKRFAVTGVTRDKPYPLTKGTEGSEVLYFTANPNGEAEVITVFHRAAPKLRKLQFDFNFAELDIKGRSSQGNILTRYSVRKIAHKEQGVSTLDARSIWFDDTVQRLNAEERGTFLGKFKGDDKILTVMQSGEYKLHSFDLSTHFDEDMILIEKWNPQKPLTAIYWDGEKEQFTVKRFLVEPSPNKVKFITEHEKSVLEHVFSDWLPQVELKFSKVKGDEPSPEKINLSEFIAVKGLKAIGNKLSQNKIKSIERLEPLPYDEPQVEQTEEVDLTGDSLPLEIPVDEEDIEPVSKEVIQKLQASVKKDKAAGKKKKGGKSSEQLGLELE